MYQWNVAQELAEVGNLEHTYGEADRLRAEALEDWHEEHPSLLTRFIRVFRREPEPFVARSRTETDIIRALGPDAARFLN
jgi:hypothetical protein